MLTILGRIMKYYFGGTQPYYKYWSVLMKIVFKFIVCYPSSYFGLKFQKPVSFSFFSVIDHGNKYETIKY